MVLTITTTVSINDETLSTDHLQANTYTCQIILKNDQSEFAAKHCDMILLSYHLYAEELDIQTQNGSELFVKGVSATLDTSDKPIIGIQAGLVFFKTEAQKVINSRYGNF